MPCALDEIAEVMEDDTVASMMLPAGGGVEAFTVTA
jgi:hypothetical protein